MIFKKSSLSGILKTAVFLLSFAAAVQNVIIIGEIHNQTPQLNTQLGQLAKEEKIVFFLEDLPDHWITQETNHKAVLNPNFRPYVHRLEEFITRIFTDALKAMYNERLNPDREEFFSRCESIKKSLEFQKGYYRYDSMKFGEELCNLSLDFNLPMNAVKMIWANSDQSFKDAVNLDSQFHDYFGYALGLSETPGKTNIELSAPVPMRNQQWVNQIEKIFAQNDAKSPEVDIVLVMGMGHVEDFKKRLMKSALYNGGDNKFKKPIVYQLWELQSDKEYYPNRKTMQEVASYLQSLVTKNTKSIWKAAFLTDLFSFTYQWHRNNWSELFKALL